MLLLCASDAPCAAVIAAAAGVVSAAVAAYAFGVVCAAVANGLLIANLN